jgi:hypothetical protein
VPFARTLKVRSSATASVEESNERAASRGFGRHWGSAETVRVFISLTYVKAFLIYYTIQCNSIKQIKEKGYGKHERIRLLRQRTGDEG